MLWFNEEQIMRGGIRARRSGVGCYFAYNIVTLWKLEIRNWRNSWKGLFRRALESYEIGNIT
jgi:hypothetical protein